MGGELRRWRYFLVVAEELQMTRAARRLRIAQPSLSQQILRLEKDLGVALFARTSRGLTLTEAGEEFAGDAAHAVETVDHAIERVRERGRHLRGVLRVGFITAAAAELTPAILATFKLRCPEVTLQLRQFHLDDPLAGLTRELTDVAIAVAPLGHPEVRTVPLFSQPRVALLPADHALRHRAAVSIGDIIDEPFMAPEGSPPPEWTKFWLGENHRGGQPARIGAKYKTIDEKFAHVGLGSGISLLPSSSSRYYARRGVIHRPISELEPCQVILAHLRSRYDESVNAFITNALAVASDRAIHDLPRGQILWAPNPSDLPAS